MLRRLFASLSLGLLAAACSGGEAPLGADESAASTTQRYIVEVREWNRGRASVMENLGRVARELPNRRLVAAHLTDEAAAALGKNPNVVSVEPDPERALFAQTTPYGISMVQADDAAFSGEVGRNRKVCVIDSGLYTAHEDLAGIPTTGAPGNLPWDVDGCGHGTHVAGTIAALDNGAGVIGVAPRQVSLHIVRVFGDDCSWTYASDLIAALDECRDAGANVVSMSLGGARASRAEENAFNAAWAAGIISVAAAGNDGNTRRSYPASYESVISVAALDSNQQIADFSQQNAAVDVAAPGVGVLSTVPWISVNTVTAGSQTYSGSHIENAAFGSATGNLADGGLCAAAGSWAGRVVACQRGDISFFDKVNNAQAGGAVAVIIYNNVPGGFSGTLGDGNSSNIPAVGLSQEDGHALLASSLNSPTTVSANPPVPGSGYEAWDGTSMATPHVSGVAALLWSQNTSWTHTQIRDAIETTALDLGAAGRDNAYGHGLVQAAAALDFLNEGGGPVCLPRGASCTADDQCCSNDCRGRNRRTCR